MAVQQIKPFYKSKTFWLNTVGILIIGLQFILSINAIVDPEFQALILAVLNILLRFKTREPITLR